MLHPCKILPPGPAPVSALEPTKVVHHVLLLRQKPRIDEPMNQSTNQWMTPRNHQLPVTQIMTVFAKASRARRKYVHFQDVPLLASVCQAPGESKKVTICSLVQKLKLPASRSRRPSPASSGRCGLPFGAASPSNWGRSLAVFSIY